MRILAPLEAQLNAKRSFLWWVVAWLLVVVAVAALAHIFGTSAAGYPGVGHGAG